MVSLDQETTIHKKMVVALICHFSNNEIQNIIQPWKIIPEFAPWIPQLLKIFENNNDVELHVISPHKFIYKDKSFQLRNINYYFFNAHIPFWGRHWPGFFKLDFWSDFLLNKFKVYYRIKRIKPNIIHLFGIENAYYSSSILQFKEKYPIAITIQGFNLMTYESINYQLKKSIKIESKILTTFNSYITNTETVGHDISTYNKNAKIYQTNFPIKFPQSLNVKKKFDLVFFARVCKNKGIEDLLKAVSIIKKEYSDISLCVIGGGKMDEWITLANELNISNNVKWIGFLPTQNDVHQMASEARISVLPTYHDIISGTIIESLFLKIPVVAYNVGSIHEINKKEVIVTLVEKFDISGLAKSILMLLNNPKLCQEIGELGYIRANEMFNPGNNKIKIDILKAYTDIINDFQNSSQKK